MGVRGCGDPRSGKVLTSLETLSKHFAGVQVLRPKPEFRLRKNSFFQFPAWENFICIVYGFKTSSCRKHRRVFQKTGVFFFRFLFVLITFERKGFVTMVLIVHQTKH
jgi:hypothetical protein